jgi:alpha-galactosidase
MKKQGLSMSTPSPETYEPFWCGWGYESDFTLNEIYGTLPKIKELGIKWVVIDDRWFDRYGDWNPRKKIFPGGEKQVKEFVDSLHKLGFLVKIWWTPTLAQPESPPPGGKWPSHDPGSSDLVKNHPDWLVLDSLHQHPRCPRNMYFLNASLPAVQDHVRKLTHKFIADWGFDGHKLDAFWVVPPSYDSSTAKHPEDAYSSVPDLIRIIYAESKRLKPYSVTEICNCGTPQDFYQSLFIDQPVVADPTSFTQVRFRVKAFKALWGPQTPVFTDHVEHVATFTDPIVHDVEDNDKSPDDFASTIGTGGVPGTKFTWPKGFPKVTLTPEREAHWKKWLGIYQDKMLSKGDYLNLYDLAYDLPETHVIRKDSVLYYGMYNKDWHGKVVLKGLQNRSYTVRDYAANIVLGTVKGPVASLDVNFKNHLLLECIPEPDNKQVAAAH